MRFAGLHARIDSRHTVARTLGNCLSAANYARLRDLVGPGGVKELMFTGRLVPGHEAHALGLVNPVIEAPAINAEVRSLAATIAGNAPLTIQATREALRRIRRTNGSIRPPLRI